jgi:hypothetical protein
MNDISLVGCQSNLDMTLFTSEVSFPQASPGILPQNPQACPSLFKYGFWLAQVPLNSPSLRNSSRTDMKMKNTAMKPIPNNKVVILKNFTQIYQFNDETRGNSLKFP